MEAPVPMGLPQYTDRTLLEHPPWQGPRTLVPSGTQPRAVQAGTGRNHWEKDRMFCHLECAGELLHATPRGSEVSP